MSKHDVERAKARKAVDVATKRSRKKASMKRAMTMTAKAAATSAAMGVGVYAANRYLSNHNVTLNGQSVRFSTQNVSSVVDIANKARKFMGYMY